MARFLIKDRSWGWWGAPSYQGGVCLSNPKIVGFVCRWVENDLDKRSKALTQNGIKLYQLNCAANITANSLNNAFTKGADVVFILACGQSTSCKYYDGEAKVNRTTSALELMLQDLGLQSERLILARPQEFEEDPLGRVLNEALAKAKELEPNPFYQGS